MNVFVIGSPIETAKCLDPRRLNKQIIECKQILKAIDGETKAWANHPATKMYMKVKSEREIAQSCPTLHDPMDCSPPGFSVPGIFQAKVLEWVPLCGKY